MVRDPGALLPGGFWAAVAVWVERPQVANRRLCGVRVDARRSAALPRTEQESRAAAGCGSEERSGHGPRSLEDGPGPRPSAGPEEPQGRRHQGEDRREAAAAPLLAGAPGQPSEAGGGEGDFSASELDSLWDDFSRGLVGDHRELLAFLTGSGAGLQSEAQRELDVVLRTVVPKRSPHCPLAAPRREIVVQGRGDSDTGRCPDKQNRTRVNVARTEFKIHLQQGDESRLLQTLGFV